MEIKIKPSELIERFIWDKYVYYCLSDNNKSEIQEIIENNLEINISEEDSFVIGLTNVIYTDELLYKFKQYILDVLFNKNTEYDRRLYVNKQLLLDNIIIFKNKIPQNYISDNIIFNKNLNEIQDKYEIFAIYIDNLEITLIDEWEFVKCGQVKKILNKLWN